MKYEHAAVRRSRGGAPPEPGSRPRADTSEPDASLRPLARALLALAEELLEEEADG